LDFLTGRGHLMAEVEINDSMLVVKLNKMEKIQSLHGDISIPLGQITDVEIDNYIHRSADLFGFKIGTKIPGVMAVATITWKSRKIFAAIHHDTPRGLKIKLTAANFDELLLGLENPEGVKGLLDSVIQNSKNV